MVYAHASLRHMTMDVYKLLLFWSSALAILGICAVHSASTKVLELALGLHGDDFIRQTHLFYPAVVLSMCIPCISSPPSYLFITSDIYL